MINSSAVIVSVGNDIGNIYLVPRKNAKNIVHSLRDLRDEKFPAMTRSVKVEDRPINNLDIYDNSPVFHWVERLFIEALNTRQTNSVYYK